jgi:non-ribosomal peptide synthase protein (TIGR01720 family)
LAGYAQSEALQQELDGWLALKNLDVAPLPTDHGVNGGGGDDSDRTAAYTQASVATVYRMLDPDETLSLLQDAPAAYKTQINDLLLAALAHVLSHWIGSRTLVIDVEGHGREEIVEGIDLSRTVGWFTTIAPIALRLPATDEPGEQIKTIKEQLRRLPNRGIGYGVLRYLCPDATVIQRLQALPQVEVLFNYLGQFDRVASQLSQFKLAPQLIGSYGLQNRRHHRLEVNAYVIKSQLQVEFTYSVNVHRPSTIESVAADYMTRLRTLIAHCLHPEAGGYTPSDFPLAGLDGQQLDQLSSVLSSLE